jgi:VanZ family protein
LRHCVAHATINFCEDARRYAVIDDLKSRFRAGAKVCSVAIVVLLAIGALGPASWTPRTALGWQIDHVLGYFVITLLVCFAWPQPFAVGGVLMAAAFLLEGLQAFSPGRSANLVAALCSAGGVLAAAVVAELFIQAWRWHLKRLRHPAAQSYLSRLMNSLSPR